MGIEASYRRVTLEEFEKLYNDAAYANVYFGYDLETDEEIYAYFEALESGDRYLDLNKGWRVLHYLFTGDFPYDSDNEDAPLLHKVFMGGTATCWEATYGMVRYLTVDEVNNIADALNHISEDDLKLRLDNLFDRESRVDIKPHYLNLSTQLVKFFNEAAQEGDIVLLSFN